MLISYNWLKDYLGKDIPPVTKLAELLTLHSFEIEEVTNLENDTLIDIKVLPDRAGDCLSHRGIAREIATLIDVSLIFDPLAEKINLPTTDNFLITIENEKDCSRFMVAHMTGVEIKPSPKWLQERLMTIGQKSINNIVDATNYVMYSLGQPMHAYDADLFLKTQDGKWHFDIRRSRKCPT
jgi:phenylalanyl-tRNA synthetase beta chain